MSSVQQQQSRKPTIYQVVRLVFAILTFATGCLSIVFSQLLVNVTLGGDEGLRTRWIGFTKRNFVILITFITSLTCPTDLELSFDSDTVSCREVLANAERSLLKLNTSAILIANHQLYTDWVFLWFVSYLNECAENFYIIMKKSLERIPILGYGMKNYDFIFLNRKWDLDRSYMIQRFAHLSSVKKHWLLIFPEGTNLSPNTKPRSDDFMTRQHLDFKLDHVLLPRVKGLYLACKHMHKKTNLILDFTMAYSDHLATEYAQDSFTLRSIYLLGKGPKSLSMFVRAIDISSIDGCTFDENANEEEEEEDMRKFEVWLNKLWVQKDKMMDNYYKTGHLVEGVKSTKIPLKLRNRFEILNVYVIPIVFFVLTWLACRLITTLLR
ncbi:hypothetical protein KL918_000885 [Ogataea parapolymorpha]|uniref:Phospholipid/glycerol acyltransferase domain-containing protein n=1 Tax=Ogataea parapolymorpha (strain ATCC 26012 / BCRC 20466 / JCM 22074 / NRRL Y-7560 / DL-1) TaxID=871575 RepID=W1QA98_OGAPD|nr:hypothetical protein HPODL_01381 [Ogataea parapolymorpha DL-1]ESW97278.1 hypothetical protein HPODL_01381 [Ogataea parapolymorpha DL-1]KAG7869340.1 hypothetical protein KL918_000885 [Ogataea parapolymorpha]KAG7875608.1 hypothetical protein KL916_000279 [Ogataea parapolymorpha]